MGEPRQVRGYFVRPMIGFINELDAAKQAAIRGRVGSEMLERLAAVSVLDWSELGEVERTLDAILEAHGGPSAALEVDDRVGRAIAHAATNTLLRLLMKIATPAMVSRQMKPMWRRYFNFATFEIESLNASGASYMVDDGFKHAPAIGRGWLGYIMDAIGRRNVVVKCEPESGLLSDGRGQVRWRVDWAT